MEDTLEQQLKAAIEAAIDAGWSLNAITRASGVTKPQLHYFRTGERELRLTAVQNLCGFFGMRLTKPKIPRPPERGRK